MTDTTDPTPRADTLPVFVNDDYAACAHAFDTTRKALAVRESIVADPVAGVEICDPSGYYEAADRIARLIHSREYVAALLTGKPGHLATSQGFTWDDGIWTMARAHLAGMLAAVHHAMRTGGTAGSLSSGMHHAAWGTGSGYCTLNGCAAAALCALELGAERVLVLDFDSHAGGGTWDIIGRVMPGRVVQVDVTVSPFDAWTPTRPSRFILAKPETYTQAISRALDHARRVGPFDFVVYNAGMDPINSGVSVAAVKRREAAVRDFIGSTPAVFGLAGGYTWGHDISEVVGWHRLTIERWAAALRAPSLR